jgi:hypothetical protein
MSMLLWMARSLESRHVDDMSSAFIGDVSLAYFFARKIEQLTGYSSFLNIKQPMHSGLGLKAHPRKWVFLCNAPGELGHGPESQAFFGPLFCY